jgi:ubiquinone/menaquinone biosynthesis C-methylase UbiE
MKHNRVIHREFSKQASRFGEKGLTLSRQEILNWIMSLLPLDNQFRVLDVAAGTGILSLAVAPHVREVVAIDITPQMLAQAQLEMAKSNLDNISIEQGNAEKLPHTSDSFDLILSRLAIHHFEKPILPVREMDRVCKPGHRIGIIDLLSPEDERIAKVYNHLERLRDPSHVWALSKSQMEKLLGEAGITLEKVETRDVEVDFQKWVQLTGTKPQAVEVLQNELKKEMNNGTTTGMRPFMKNHSLKFLQVWSVVLGTKL